MSLTRSRFAKHTTALAVCLAAAGTVLAAAGPAQAASGRHHDGHTGAIECRGQGTYPDAVVRYRSQFLTDAPLSTVFRTQTDVRGCRHRRGGQDPADPAALPGPRTVPGRDLQR
ncbi:hypothetical protein [Streptomyces olivaceus]|uniref:hypothetical protein n=1 Tax=Streptomyces olivaceus TaxID=47716 RepID=UPI0033B106B4